MKIELDNLVSITDANQNFSKVARMVDEKGTAVILKNNVPKYVILDYDSLKYEVEEADASDILVEEAAAEYITKHSKAFKELAK